MAGEGEGEGVFRRKACIAESTSVHLKLPYNVHSNAMSHDISIKEFREKLAEIADRVEEGETFRVIRRSKPAFVVMKITDDDDGAPWETVIDFTENGTSEGVPIKEALKVLKKINR